LEQVEGWLFDVYIQGSKAVLWIKTKDGGLLRLTDSYSPFFHVEPAEEASEAEEDLLYRLCECPEVKSATLEEKLTSLESGKRRALVRVETYGTGSFKAIIRSLEGNLRVSRVYNAGLRHVQRYLFTKLRVEPSSRVRVFHEGERLEGIEKLDDSQELAPPPLSLLSFDLDQDLSAERRVIKVIRAAFRGERKAFEGPERDVLSSFCSYVLEKDPDLLVCPKCDRVTYPLLKLRLQENDMALDLGRCGDRDQVHTQGSLAGRILLGDVFYGFSSDEWGIGGLIERTRFSFAPMGLSMRWLSNKSIESRSCFEMLARGYVIPREEYFEDARSMKELTARDRGGITITPEAGRLHFNVAALDFDSQYPNIILKNNLSYETVSDGGSPGSGQGILPAVLAPWLLRRMWLKKLRKTLPEGSPSRLYCGQRIEALKMILVTIYGVSGCCRNRFGNVVAFEEINRKSREGMLKAKAMAEARGFRIIYGAVDSLFVSRLDARREDYEALAAEIGRATDLSMSLDRHFRFLAFLPLKEDPSSSALNHYFGLTYDGKVEARGIELRRSDTPEIVRAFQTELIRRIFNSGDLQEAYTEGVLRGMELLHLAIGKIRGGDVDAGDLVLRKRLGKDIGEYTASVPQRSAALQLLHADKEIEVGDDIPFIYTDHDNGNPLCRVRAPELFSGSYDREIYAKMLLDAASAIWRGMGFDPDLKPVESTLDRWLQPEAERATGVSEK